MSYINALQLKDEVLVWERTDEGRETKIYQSPYYLYTKDPDGEFTSIYGDSLTRHDFSSGQEFREAKKQMDANGIEMFESDIAPELKVLAEQYYNAPVPKLNVTNYDIEVDYDPDIGFSSPANPYAPINSVALHHAWKDEYVILAVPPNMAPFKSNNDDWVFGDAPQDFYDQMEEIAPMPEHIKVRIDFCRDEHDLLLKLLDEFEDSDVVVGWNNDTFDWPYIGKRVESVLGKKQLARMSFDSIKSPRWREEDSVFGGTILLLDTYGRINADYMKLFKKYEMAERPSYKLEAIADEFLPELPKLEYEGSLAQLYRENFAWFVRYNIRDTEILEGFEKKLGYVDVANTMYHMSCGLYKHVGGTIKLAELATINFCHYELPEPRIVNDIAVIEESGGIQGAFVLIPQRGLHEYVGSVDLASLYPAAIRSLNISPEKIVGQLYAVNYEELTPEQIEQVKSTGFTDIEYAKQQKKPLQVYGADLIANNSDDEVTLVLATGEELTDKASKFRKLFLQQKWAVSGYGTVFDQNEKGIVPNILENWYNMRKKYKKQMGQAKEGMDAILKKYDSNAPETEIGSPNNPLNDYTGFGSY